MNNEEFLNKEEFLKILKIIQATTNMEIRRTEELYPQNLQHISKYIYVIESFLENLKENRGQDA